MIITILRKPLEGTVAENTLKHGCGALNIDATRISTSDNLNVGVYAKNPIERHDGKENWRYERGNAGDYVQPNGRWPANFILIHKDSCELKGTKKIKSSSGRGSVKKHSSADKLGNQGFSYSKESRKEGTVMVCHVDKDGKETVADWDCVEGCPVKELDQQSGNRPSTGNYPSNAQSQSLYRPNQGAYQKQGTLYSDSGGASRFFKQFKKENDQ